MNHNNQSAFDTVVAHLFKQSKQAVDEKTGDCFYRCPRGSALRCAIGALMGDNEYDAQMEGAGIDGLLNGNHTYSNGKVRQYFNYVPPRSIQGVDVKLLRELQAVHDEVFPSGPQEVLFRLRNIAIVRGLKLGVLDKHMKREFWN
jgi:hypothetical protein